VHEAEKVLGGANGRPPSSRCDKAKLVLRRLGKRERNEMRCMGGHGLRATASGRRLCRALAHTRSNVCPWQLPSGQLPRRPVPWQLLANASALREDLGAEYGEQQAYSESETYEEG